jgi:aryl-alcohol dehydrogenase-like predicted oxidoreductase
MTGNMRYNQLGASGLTVSTVGLGCNNFGRRLDRQESAAVVDAAIDEGINFLDTADVYGESEEHLGQILAGRRDRIVLATKFGSPTGGRVAPEYEARGSRRYINLAVDASLSRLNTEWIDLLQMHQPDPLTPLEETLGALDDLVRSGKVRYIGSSNVTARQIQEADAVAEQLGTASFISVQNEYSLINRSIEKEVIPAAQKFRLGVIPYFPLANGLLTGKYRRGATPTSGRLAEPEKASYIRDELFDVVDALTEFATARGLSVIDVSIGGLAALHGVATVIAGATHPDQVRLNAAAAQWHPSEDDLAELERITKPAEAAQAAR